MRTTTLPSARLSFLAAAAFHLACRTQLHAQAGTLDTDFSTDGLHTWDLSANDDQLTAVTVQPDGKIVGAGWVTDGNTASILVQRLLPDATPDPGFGIGGVTYTNAVDDFHYAYAVGVQSTGHVVVAGLAYDLSSDGNAILLRYLPDGTLDAAFGNGGILSTDLGGGPGFQAAWSMRVMADDRIVIVGDENANGMVCARFTADGDPDTTYGTNGVAYSGVPGSTGLCMDLYADGSVIAGGYGLPAGYPDWMLARFDPNGVLDAAFGTGGIATVNVGNGDTEFMHGVSVLADGRIAACGSQGSSGSNDEPIVGLFNSDGTLDADFGNGGLLALPFTPPFYGQARAIATPEGKLLVAGWRAQPGVLADNDFFLYRLLDDGTFDPAFAGGGQVYTDVSGSYDRAYTMALAPDGDIILAGYGFVTERATAYARFVNDLSTSVRYITSHNSMLNIFPLPAQDHVFLEYTSSTSGQVTSTLFSSDGRRVLSMDHGWQALGAQRLKIDLPRQAAPGMYLVEVVAGESVQRGRLVIAEYAR